MCVCEIYCVPLASFVLIEAEKEQPLLFFFLKKKKTTGNFFEFFLQSL